ncbi:hypothetical protein DVK05_15695 [Halorubrum sp. Atlit-8R]|jgi:hypothetical protein|uniref:Uncharacterized protein n=1 Tax=Haloplanus vescus TaxID=555874 RepID=A0A1H4AD53_9EURY|nr:MULTISPECIES: DUF6166 domain-containing protein [Halobacteria]MDS0280200.1 DUF6166 domain-containing protein [Halomicroarcula sp. S1AR25-4]MDT3437453.1 hypothetical protein [Haloarcula sp. 1CSR25-25]RLM76791.1 hypothetical protein DVK05_15695 [Halorubrum sp. Atlit-8R]SEA33472.1 hypothetical protein SAMN04488065_2725 [Haloplanus vescus]
MSRPSDTHSIEQTRPASGCDIVYVGYRQSGQAIVEKRPGQERLTPERSLALVNHSPSGFEWGYGGSGPAQLALALLLDYTGDEAFALDHYQAFKTEVVSQLDCAGSAGRWRLTGPEIDAVLHETPGEPAAPSI